jgi:hypothetical protein
VSEQTLLVDPELARQALGDVLDADAAAAPAAPAPPARPRPADATEEAPWGFKADGTPRKGPPGPGRPRKDPDSKPRTAEEPAPAAPAAPGSAVALIDERSYEEEITSGITTVWMGLSAIPFTQAHAAVLNRNAGELIPALNKAAQQNDSVRKYVLKLSGEGKWAWVLPVAMVTTPLAIGFFQVTVNKDLRAELKAENQVNFRAFLLDQARAAGMTIPDDPGQPQPQEQEPGPDLSGQSAGPEDSTPASSSASSSESSDYLLPV